MSYLLDTNIISETVKPKPNQKLIDWFKQVPIDSLYLSALTIGEIRSGIERFSASKKKETLTLWLEQDLTKLFTGRIVAIDTDIAETWGRISAQSRIPSIDGLIAATAITMNLKLVTRNIKDFKSIAGLNLLALDC